MEMDKDERVRSIEYMEDQVSKLESLLRRAKVTARMDARGQVPERTTTLEHIDNAIDQWNVLINLVPRELKAVKLDLIK